MTADDTIATGKPPVSLRRLIIPVALGIAVSVYLIVTNFNAAALSNIHFTGRLVTGLLLALLAVVIRDGAFMYKIWVSTGERMSFRKTFQTIIMWEFGAAVTPKISEVAFILVVLKKSGISYGRSVATVILNTFLDNLLFVIAFAGLYFILGPQMLAVSADCPDLQGHAIMQGVRHLASHAWIGYLMFVAAAAFFGTALFLLPGSTKNFFYWLSGLKILQRFKGNLTHLGDEVEITAREYKNREAMFWVKMILATSVNWAARYALVNALFYGFSDGSLNMLEVYARQYVLWIFLVIPSTPGASGVAEISFMAINCEFMPVGLSAAIALIWRMYSYYIYLVLGMILLPKWTKQAVEKQGV